MMRNTLQFKKTNIRHNRRIAEIFFFILLVTFGLTFANSTAVAEKLDESLAKAIYGPVKATDTLGKIVSRNYRGSNLSAQRIMIGILRANPDAFIGGNIHYLLRDSTLLLPEESLIDSISQTEADRTIKEHYRFFQHGQTGNFQVKPLSDADKSTDIAEMQSTENTIISTQQRDDKQKVDEIEQQIRSRLSDATNKQKSSSTSIEKINKADDSLQTITGSSSTEPAKVETQSKPISSTSSAIKDIELESLKIKISQLEKLLTSRGMTAEQGSVTAIPEEVKNTLRDQKEKISQLEQEKKSKAAELNALQQRIKELEVSLSEMQSSLKSQAASTKGDQGNVIADLQKENAALKQQLSELQTALVNKNKEIESLNSEIANSSKKITTLEQQLISKDQVNADLDKQIAEMEAKLANIRSTPAPGLAVLGNGETSSSGISPWVWLLPALFLLSILAYLFKRSIGQPEPALVTTQNLQKRPTSEVDREVIPTSTRSLDAGEVVAEQDDVIATPSTVPDIISAASEEESMEASIKIDIAKAYMDMEMPDAATEILNEAFEEGSQKQRLEAKHLLDKIAA